ncbi:UxaA family hydrolase [Spirosoma linguale]|uniref:D-galactarate/Altronate dehydratase second domain-containing protein n=1 Tax=Spirosoma linguale (strain ATCC 33905 / DSM 74 / LMG 10896 / Claus 1) TaxID=504472 RepID=D2QGM2_SPILD|nr:hypothetical protein Slin_2512 [Spirosoma linguale DSM 74]
MSNSFVPSDFPGATHWRAESNRQSLSFMGYYRPDGRVGTRNYWLVISLAPVDPEQMALFQEACQTVLGYQCPNAYEQQLRNLREQYRAGSYFNTPAPQPVRSVPKPVFTNIDGIRFLPVYDDSAMALEAVLDVLAGYCTHANVGGITVLSGGATTDRVRALHQCIAKRDPAFSKPMLVVDRLTYRSDSDWLTAATYDTFRGMALLNKQTRRSAPLSRLVISTQQGKTNESLPNQVVDECVQFMASVGATVLLVDTNQSTDIHGVQLISETRDEPGALMPLTVLDSTLQLTLPGLDLPLKNSLVPIITLSSDQEQTQPGEPLLKYLLKLASGELRTPSERDGTV